MNKFFLLLTLFPFFTFAQERHCGTVRTDAANEPGSPAVEAFIRQQIAKQRQQRGTETQATYQIPVIIHVVHNGEPVGVGANISAAQVYSQIEVLNEDFTRTNPDAPNTRDAFADVVGGLDIEFVPATIDPSGFPLDEPGIHRVDGGQETWTEPQTRQTLRPETIWDPLLYFNIWSLNLPDGELGYAQFPSFSGLEGIEEEPGAANTDGAIVDYTNFGSITKVDTPQLREGEPYNLGRTLTHELGHSFGLIHVWGDGGCDVDDFCEDTPASNSPNYRCEENSDEPFNCGTLDMYENYMDYTRDVCMNAFTQDQIERMIVVLENAERRVSLLNSRTGEPITEGIFADFTSDKTRVCAGGTVSFEDDTKAFNGTPVQVFDWSFEGGEPATSEDPFPLVSYNAPGTYDVRLYVEDFLDSSSVAVADYMEVIDISNALPTPFTEDFEGNIEQTGWQPDAAEGWELLSVGGNEGDLAAGVKHATRDLRNEDIRLASPLLSLPDAAFFAISFDVAYATRNNILSESLAVYVSDDCGGTRQQVWRKSGENLATTVNSGSFAPTSAEEWRRETILLRRDAFEGNVIQVIFESEGRRGNNMYVDNLLVEQTEVEAPTAEFEADYTTLIQGESTVFRNQSTNTPNQFNWTLTGARTPNSREESPRVHYDDIGLYPVSLTVGNPAGQDTETKNDYITVVSGTKIDRLGNANLQALNENGQRIAGPNTDQDAAKAEFFDELDSYEELFGVDIFFGDPALSTENGTAELVVWAVDEESGAPGDELTRQTISLSEVAEDAERGIFSRILFDVPVRTTPSRFFVGVEFNYDTEDEISILTATRNENTGWERTADGTWRPYDEPDGKDLRLSHAIYPLFSPEDAIVSGLEDNAISSNIEVYPNPAARHLFWSVSGAIRIHYVELLDANGRIVRQFSSRHNDGSLVGLAAGLYFLHFTTNQGIGVRRVMVR